MNSDRIKKLQEQTAFPDSVSVRQALLQVWNECQQENNIELAALRKENEILKDCLKLGHECIKIWIKHNNEEIDVMDREFLKQSEQLLK